MRIAWKLMDQLAWSTLWQNQETLPPKGGKRVDSLRLSPDHVWTMAWVPVLSPRSPSFQTNKQVSQPLMIKLCQPSVG